MVISPLTLVSIAIGKDFDTLTVPETVSVLTRIDIAIGGGVSTGTMLSAMPVITQIFAAGTGYGYAVAVGKSVSELSGIRRAV